MGLTYSDSGVDRSGRSEAKKRLSGLERTHSYSRYGKILKTPFNALYPVGNGKFHVKTCDGIGTKVLVAALAGKHDTIGQDAVAMVVNDCIRCGARPMALTDVIDIQKSEPALLGEILEGLQRGADEAECPLVGGETADVPELMSAPYHINCDCVGEVDEGNIITGANIMPGDAIIGLRSSGAHSNGVSLLRRALFKEWDGKYDAFDTPDGIDRPLVLEALEPTRIYVKDFFELKNIDIRGAVNITGDAYLKFGRLTRYGFRFDNFKPQALFDIIQEAGDIATDEMFKTFNMGWGFAVIVDKNQKDDVLQLLKGSEEIGAVTENRNIIVVKHRGKEIVLS